MAERVMVGFPFDASEVITPEGTVKYDYELYAQDFADVIGNFFSNGILVPGGGVLSEELRVTKTSANTLSINSGKIAINGRIGPLNSPHTVNVTSALSGKQRWDRLVIELNTNEEVNEFRPVILQGTEVTDNPNVPELVRDGYLKVYQMSLARIRVTYDGIQELIDERADTSLCGISNVLIGVRPPMPVTGDDASNISYDNTVSGLAGTTVQSAIDELVTPSSNLLLSSGSKWVSESTYGYFKQEVSLYWATVESQVIVDVVPSKREDTVLWGNIWKVEVGAGKVTFYSSERLNSALTVKIKEVK